MMDLSRFASQVKQANDTFPETISAIDYVLLQMITTPSSDQTGMVTLADMDIMIDHVHQSSSENAPFFTMSPRMYRRVRTLAHLGKLRPLPRRKLRKCHMRKIHRFLRHERTRYTYGGDPFATS